MAARRSANGFALSELLVALAVLGVLLAGILGLFHAGVAAYTDGAARVQAQQAARVGLERMVRELREAGYDPTGIGFAPIVVADPARVTFQRDLNKNGVVDATSERVTFVLRPGESVLRRDAGAGAQPIIEGVRGLAFTYFDRGGVITTDASRVTSIAIAIEVGFGRARSVMRTRVSLRNALR